VDRSNFANESRVLSPEAAALAINARAFSRKTDILTGKSAADRIDSNSVSGQSVGCEFSDVVIDRHSGPVFRQHLAAIRFDLAERDGLETASALEAQAKATNAREQVEDAQFAHGASLKAPQAFNCASASR
jgi:hypothetical protein